MFPDVSSPTTEDIWKGHICTLDVKKFKSPLIRALLLKGHAYKLEHGAETLLRELEEGLDGYMTYKTRRNGDPSEYEEWKRAITTRVKQKLGEGQCTLYPQGDIPQRRQGTSRGGGYV